MTIDARTRHDRDFDILTHPFDPLKSSYACYAGYTEKIAALYEQLGIKSALWAFPAELLLKYVESRKEYEYLLRLDESRVVAYVNEDTWLPFLKGVRDDFEFSVTPAQYQMTSLIIPTPIATAEVICVRRYRILNGPDRFEVVKEMPFAAWQDEQRKTCEHD
jgi:hypothetical protein